jgi:hypothetical protein
MCIHVLYKSFDVVCILPGDDDDDDDDDDDNDDPSDHSWYSFLVEAESIPVLSAEWRVTSIQNFNNIITNRNRDLPACTFLKVLPQETCNTIKEPEKVIFFY